eukprot:m.257601 g.257601  ORF g.257601 m.257601 type:complete len:336 (+) comp35464_c0_seq1:346-1353(+)
MANANAKTLENSLKEHGVTITTLMGSGAFSNVYKGYFVNKNGSKCHMAVKCYQNDSCPAVNSSQLVELAKREFGIIKDLQHTNIIHALQFVASANVTFMGQELAAGDLFSRLATRTKFTAEAGLRVLDGILSGLNYMHSTANLVHMDLKSENVLLDAADVPKLADMDAAMPLYSETETVRGTRDVHPPELWLKQPRYKVLDPSIDVWAVGLLAHTMITGRYAWDTPVDSDPGFAAFKNKPWTKDQHVWYRLPPNLANAFSVIFANDASQRPSANELRGILSSCWVEDVQKLGIASEGKAKPTVKSKAKKDASMKASKSNMTISILSKLRNSIRRR